MQIHAEISNVHGLCHLRQRNFSYEEKVEAIKQAPRSENLT